MPDELKSAFELAMEKLKGKKEFEVAGLTAEQKSQIEELRKIYKARQAEIEIHFQGQIQKARAAMDSEAAEKASDNFNRERDRLNRELESKISKIKQSA